MGKHKDRMLFVDLKELKEPWMAYCSANHINCTAGIRAMVSERLKGANPPVTRIKVNASEDTSCRIKITLTPSEREQATLLAQYYGMSLTRWLVGLLRAHVTSTAQFGQAELEAVAESNRQLLVISRKLQHLRREGVLDTDTAELCSEVVGQVSTHTKYVSELILSNAQRWRLEGGTE